MKMKYLAFALPLALSTAAFAADSSSGVSVYEHQTDSGKWEVTPGFTFGSIKTNFNATAANGNLTSASDSIFNFSVAGEYGINEMLSVGLKIGYQTDSFSLTPSGSSSPSASGMTDPVLYVNGKNAVGPGLIRWGALLDFSLGAMTLSSDGKTYNESSGGITLTPFVGYEMANIGPGTLGARLAYDLYQSDRSFTNNMQTNTSEKIKAGNNLSFVVFYEMPFDPVIWGVDVGIVNHSAATFNNGTTDTSMNDGQTNFKVETYAAWTVAPDITVLPTIGYGPMGVGGYLANGATSQNGIYGTVAARFGF